MSQTGSFGSKQDYSFGQVAIRENLATFDQVKECLDIQSKLRTMGVEPKKLGEILVDKGYLTPEQVIQITRLQLAGVDSAAPPAPASGAAPAPGTASQKLSIPGYELISKIGQGAMGMVYKARQISMDRIVAVKVLAPRYSKDRSFVDRFLREARAVAKLNHENIISGIDVGEQNGHHYFVMEFVDGAPVTGLMKRDGRIDERRTLQIGLQVAKALQHAHKGGIVHRDIKPENVMLTSGGVAKLCDLGLAKQAKGDAGVTMDGTSVGTPNYISPEQARGEEVVDIRSDIYSLGASLYHMATGSPPFSGANPMVVMTKHVTEQVEPPKKRLPSLSEGFNTLVLKMMQKRREDRHQDPDALIQDIQTLLDGGQIAASGKGTGPRTASAAPRPRPSTVSHGPLVPQRSPAIPIAIAAGVVVLLGAGWMLMGKGTSAPPPPPPPPSTAQKPPVVAPPPAVDAADRVRREVQAFRELIEPNLSNESVPDRYTSPYTRILNRIEHYRKISDFVGEKAWTTELAAYTDHVNQLLMKGYYGPIQARVKEHFDSGRYPQAMEELAKVDDAVRWFRREDKPVPTIVGKDVEDWQAKIGSSLKEAYLSGMLQADQAFRDPKRRDEAYGLLDAALEAAPPDGRGAVEERREKYLREDVGLVVQAAAGTPDGAKKASARIEVLKSLHSKNAAATKVLAQLASDIEKQMAQAASAAVSQAMLLYSTTHKPRFEEAMRSRDLVAVRKSLYDLYFTTGSLQTALLPGPTDLGLLRAFLDPQRAGPGEARKVAAAAEEGLKFCAQRPSGTEAAKELYTDLRIVALLEDLVEQAAEGAKAASKEAGRFKAGFTSALAAATAAEPAPRKAGEGLSLSISAGATKTLAALYPSGKGSLPEDDIVALARKAPGALADPLFALKAFYLQLFADRRPAAKDWLDQLATAEARLGTERYLDRFKGMTSAREEAEAAKAFTEAWELLHKKKEAAGGAKKFKELAERYAGTEFMQAKVAPSGKTRLEIVQDLFGGGGPKPVKGSLKEVFGHGDVKDLGRGRFEVTYTFKDDREFGMFTVVSGNVAANRTPDGLRLNGTGQWAWSPPLKGNMAIEVTFQPRGDGAVGLVTCGDGDRAGYLATADLPLPGLPANDLILKMPAQGAGILNAILAQGGTGIQQARGQPNTIALVREGSRLRFTLGQGRLDADHSQFVEGKLAIGLVNHAIVVERIRVTGEPDPAWLDAEIKKAEGK